MLFEHPSAADLSSGIADVCLVGSGPAGITLATKLAERGMTVTLLEAGPEQYSEASQFFYAGDVFGPLKFEPDVLRLRFFGGSSNHWGGWCRPLDPHDFRPKIDGIDTAWPIGAAEVQPYLPEAMRILELADPGPDEPLDDTLVRVNWSYSPPVAFGRKFREALEKAPGVRVVLNAAVVNLVEDGGAIRSVEVRDPAGASHVVRARRFVLCAGGIENSRLLLWANRRNAGRVVRQPDALGRYWMDHPHFAVGDALVSQALPFRYDAKRTVYVAPTETTIRREKILNCGLRLVATDYDATQRIVRDLACVAPDLAKSMMRRLRRNLICGVRLHAAWEQAPRPYNRIVLGERLDPFGVPRADIHWRLTELELHTVRRTSELLSEYLLRKDLGRIKLDDWVTGGGGFPADDQIFGPHHMGGTRMSRDARQGVVDADCRVHGMRNLWVAGSSVFPSGGHANPTLTIVQLALRLADHLAAPEQPHRRREAAGARVV